MGPSLSLKGKLILAMTGVILVTIFTIVFLVNRGVYKEVEVEIGEKLVQSSAIFQSLQKVKGQGMAQSGAMMTRIAFVKALITSRDPEAILQFAQDSMGWIQASVIIITDESGVVLARTDTEENGENLSRVESVRKALRGEESTGLYSDQNQAYFMVSLPVSSEESLLGSVSLGQRIDDEYVSGLHQFTRSDISFMGADGRILASNWQGNPRNTLQNAIGDSSAGSAGLQSNQSGFRQLDVDLGAETYSTLLVPFINEAGKTEGTFLIQVSKDGALEFFYNLRRIVLAISAVSLMGAIAVIFFVARKISLPFREVVAEINAKANEITEGSTQQASGAAEQASTVTEVSTTVEELSQTAGQIAENSENLSRSSEETLQGIREIKDRVDQMSKKIFGLGDKSHSIGSITKVIDDLADRTNLLALNAAIEAARAGEAGHGFAVVAAEVGKLAERSTESTGEIRQLIAEIQAEVNSTIMGVEDTTKWTDKGLEMVGDTVQVTKEIYMATQQQKSAAEQVVEAMTNIDKVTTTFASTTKQSASTAQELNSLANRLNAAIIGSRQK